MIVARSENLPTAQTERRRRRLILMPCGLTLVVWLLFVSIDVAATEGPNPSFAGSTRSGYLLSTPQITDPLAPLAHAEHAAGSIGVRTAVVTVADPLETHLGRAFDVQVSALIRAFHTKDFVLDGFALTWNLSRAEAVQDGGDIPVNGSTSFTDDQRSRPSVLVFRRDLWRHVEGAGDGGAAGPGSEYFVVFLVGESPTFGVQPHAFRCAITCAARLADASDPERFAQPCACNESDLARKRATLEIIGPTFSGSMHSLALVLASLSSNGAEIKVNLQSPSATVQSNHRVTELIHRIVGEPLDLQYTSLASSLNDQLGALARYAYGKNMLKPKGNKGKKGGVLILAEESTFGHGVSELLRSERRHDIAKSTSDKDALADSEAWSTFLDITRVAGFPQNIAAIRGEHSRIDQKQSESRRDLLKVRNRLLELDLSGIDLVTDRPPAYRRLLSSRSDELMLYGTFDALRVRVNPAMVVIVATDVRDRLFLLNEVRKSLPNALPVLMEMDYLTTHPDYRKISRGALVVPNGDTVLRVDSNGCLTSCGQGGTGPCAGGKTDSDGDRKSYLSFPADYAANLFRAALNLIDTGSSPKDQTHSGGSNCDQKAVSLYVTTLAGFQQVYPDVGSGMKDDGRPTEPAAPRSRLLAADGRLLLDRPITIFFLIAAIVVVASSSWLAVFGRAHLVMFSPLRHPNPLCGIREARFNRENDEGEDPDGAKRKLLRLNRFLSIGLLVLGLAVLVIAGTHLYGLFLPTRQQTWSLAHGRDVAMLIGLFLLYLCVAIVAGWKLSLWRRRCIGHLSSLAGTAGIPSPDRSRGQVALSAAVVVVVALLLLAWFSGIPNSVDSALTSLFVNSILLLLGFWFLAELWTESRRLAWFAQLLAPTAGLSAESAAAKPALSNGSPPSESWANPIQLNSLPQSPFNLHFRERDLAALAASSDETWRAQTRELLECRSPIKAESNDSFRIWQARLVAEMRYGTTAIRSCAWAAILAPTTILLGIGLYPPYGERLMTTASVVLVFVAFALTMSVVIKLEQHPLLGPLFTLNRDKLSFGGVIGALWGKLIAAAVILIPVLFPDALSGLYGLLQSIDSLR
ncbi:hypothetical protein BDD21_0338 [Thiocapsa rosea]|uniref:Uncharacterized protein n=1 Tax=Thiocapsa rosea TaxID=69360 RepID=A0A495V2Y1_9GAMM|nr:hypothetical protein BDD21_0338 [Thiocapsa rosea]